MRILHTADWHLGHRLYGNDRTEEHERALNWLLDVIREREVDLLVVAGDVFDSMNPSNTARNLYYDFLGRLQTTRCRAAVIVGGNHDSPSQLDAPAGVLRYLNVHVVGGARQEIEEQVVPIWRNPGDDHPALLVAAVPYLRDRDLKYSVIGESASEKVERLRESIRSHYRDIAAAADAQRPHPAVPVLATGHLFASGGEDAEDKVTNIYLADRNNIEAGHFSDCFDYVALGHIHRPQRVGGKDHIRYSGSLIPMTFGEARIEQSVCVLEMGKAGERVEVEQVRVPAGRSLLTLHGCVETVKAELTALVRRQRSAEAEVFQPWVDVRVVSPHPLPLLREELQEILTPTAEEENGHSDHLPRMLRCSRVIPDALKRESREPVTRNLEELHPEDVFYRLCHGAGDERPDYPELLESFRELRSWMEDNPVA